MDSGGGYEILRMPAEVEAATKGWGPDLFDAAIVAKLHTLTLIEGAGVPANAEKAARRTTRLQALRGEVQMFAAAEGDMRRAKGVRTLQPRFRGSAFHERRHKEQGGV